MPTTDPRALRVLIVDDSASDADAITAELTNAGWTIDARRVDSAEALNESLAAQAPDLVLAATSASLEVPETLAQLKSARPGCPLIVVTSDCEAHMAVAAMRAGAEDIVQTGKLERLSAAVESAISIRTRLKTLSPRQLQVLSLVAQGNTSPEIATRLNISVKTVETHRGELMKRIGARDVVGLVHYALRVGLVSNAA